MSFLFKQKKQKPEAAVVADPYKDVRQSVNKWITGNLGPGEQYGGDLVAPMSEYEKESLKWLSDYGKQGSSSLRQAGTAEIEKTLGGQYDPTTSPYYQAVKAEASRNLKETQADIADRAAGGGRYWTGARLEQQREAGTDVANYLNELLGSMAERERERRLGVLPMAESFARAEEQIPLEKATAFQTLGGLPRSIQQAYDTALYNEWLRATQDRPLQVAGIGAGVQQAPLYGQVGYKPSIYQEWIKPMQDAAMQAMMMQFAGGVK